MGVFADFAVDQKKASDGVAIKYSANADGSFPTFHVKRMAASNPAYTKSLERHTRPVRRLIEKKTMSADDARKIRIKVFVDAILVGWDNVQDEAGKAILYSAESATELFNQLPDLFDDLENQASDIATFRSELQEDEAKN